MCACACADEGGQSDTRTHILARARARKFTHTHTRTRTHTGRHFLPHIPHHPRAHAGIPELKRTLGGVTDTRYLTLSTLVAKFFGLALSLASGLSIGREGPYVHMSAILAKQLGTRIGAFRKYFASPMMHRQMLGVSVAAGAANAHGTQQL